MSELIKLLKEVEENNMIAPDKRIKFVEKCGQKLVETIRINDPHRDNCRDIECLACKSSMKYTNCRKMNVGYQIQCEDCKNDGKIRSYEGETWRNLYLRGKEHQKLYENENKATVLYKHALEDHKEDPHNVRYSMKITGTFKTPISRITNEGIRIKDRDPEQLLNSKSEFYGPSVKRRTFK